MGIPKNVQDVLDEDGNILENLLEESGVTEEQEEPEEEVTTEESEKDTTQEPQEPQEEPEEEVENQEEPEEEELELTPKEVKEPQEDPSEITKKILDKLESISQPAPREDTTPKEPVQEADGDRRIRELEERLAAYENKNEAINREAFISDVKDRVKTDLFPKHSFEEIVNSQQFDEYLGRTVFGVSKRTLLKRAMDERDRGATFEIFEDFKNSRSPKKDTTKGSLSDLAVPEKSGTKSAPKRRSKFDFKQSDFQSKLRQFERGKLNQKDFNEFTEKFNKALDEDRVDMDN